MATFTHGAFTPWTLQMCAHTMYQLQSPPPTNPAEQ